MIGRVLGEVDIRDADHAEEERFAAFLCSHKLSTNEVVLVGQESVAGSGKVWLSAVPLPEFEAAWKRAEPEWSFRSEVRKGFGVDLPPPGTHLVVWPRLEGGPEDVRRFWFRKPTGDHSSIN